MNITIPLKVELKGEGTSAYDRETILRRLEVLKDADTDDAPREIEYLRELLARHGWVE